MEFLRQKWAYYFTGMDVAHHGWITRAETDKTLEHFPLFENLTDKETKLSVSKLGKWWTDYVFKGRSKITDIEFLQDWEDQYKKDKTVFQETIRAMFTEIFSIFYPKSITIDSYVRAYKVFGKTDEEKLRKRFEQYKPIDGKISIEEYIKYWVHFLTNDDPTETDVVLSSYKAGLA